MKILMAAPLRRKISPSITASRPRVIYEIVNELLERGHQVSILGTGDSNVPGAAIIPVIPNSFNELPAFENPFYAETSFLVKQVKKIEEIASDFDIIHNHTFPEFINLLAEDLIKTPMVTTIHAQATPELDEILSKFPNANLVSISYAHKKLFQKAKINYVVYNGIDTNLYAFSDKKEDFLLWIGRLSKAKDKEGNFMDPKGVKWAIKLAQETDSNLILSGNVEDEEFFNNDVKPFLNNKIQWIGPISPEQPLNKEEVVKLMQKAKAFLMTINWPEPFGLVMAEAMSCGTPIIGFDRGSVSELVVDARTGFVVSTKDGLGGLKKAVAKINTIDYQDCRRHVEKNFTIKKMVDGYENIYKKLLNVT